MSTLQDRMRATLAKTGLPHKEIECYGSQIVVTVWSPDAAERWRTLLAKFAKVRGVTASLDYNKENRGTCLVPTVHKVWRVFAAVQ